MIRHSHGPISFGMPHDHQAFDVMVTHNPTLSAAEPSGFLRAAVTNFEFGGAPWTRRAAGRVQGIWRPKWVVEAHGFLEIKRRKAAYPDSAIVARRMSAGAKGSSR